MQPHNSILLVEDSPEDREATLCVTESRHSQPDSLLRNRR